MENNIKKNGLEVSKENKNGLRPLPGKTLHLMRLEQLIQSPIIDTRKLNELLWLGVPTEAHSSLRPTLWKLAMIKHLVKSVCYVLSICPIYKPVVYASHMTVIILYCAVDLWLAQLKKIREYLNIRNTLFNPETGLILAKYNSKQLKQIQVDIIRTHPSGFESIFSHHAIQSVMTHVLFIWAIRNPASGYVQGLNDVITPFLIVFLRERLGTNGITEDQLNQITRDSLISLESECYWCLSKLLSRVQDNFIFGQPGVVRMIAKMERLLRRTARKLKKARPAFTGVTGALLEHLESEKVELFHVCFRWMNCFLVRDLPLNSIIRLWDTYIAESSLGFSEFHVNVCTMFLIHWADRLQKMDFQQIHLFLQAPPTKDWGVPETESLLAKAFILKNLFQPSPSCTTRSTL